MSDTITAAELTTGDTFRDVEGHGQTNSHGPSVTDEVVVKKPWSGDSWLLAPVLENGRTAKGTSFALSHEEIDARFEAGRYLPTDLEVNRTLDADALPVDTSTDVYIRFGDIPDDERSYNHTDDCYEDGVSVYAAEIESVPPASEAPAMFVPIGSKTLQILMLAQRDTYLVTGERVGTGVDGEPLLRNVEIVSELGRGDEASGWVIVGDDDE
ncbi:MULTISPECIES: hypothetical protein [Haloferacaceae]|uniref:Uncharacterized protein n=1 Tax=Halorubrum glutamatedens TaxID=2707018 RepID=A0ABD5QTP9_9EURY|nr:hypothetical protein [Halobellus captivus]